MAMKLDVLLSCMHEYDNSIISRANIRSDALIINQCDTDDEFFIPIVGNNGEHFSAHFINTTERGLSKSRNMAIRKSDADVCLICDDDEVLNDEYVERIKQAFQDNPNFDILAFRLERSDKKYKDYSYNINFFNIGPVSSVQLAFKRNELILSTPFCENMGSGTGNGGGEESKFLVDCLKKGAKIKYVPIYIATLNTVDSQWFHGYTKKYWYDRGWTSRVIYGRFWGYGYLMYVLLRRAKKIDKEHSLLKIFIWIHVGFFESR